MWSKNSVSFRNSAKRFKWSRASALRRLLSETSVFEYLEKSFSSIVENWLLAFGVLVIEVEAADEVGGEVDRRRRDLVDVDGVGVEFVFDVFDGEGPVPVDILIVVLEAIIQSVTYNKCTHAKCNSLKYFLEKQLTYSCKLQTFTSRRFKKF